MLTINAVVAHPDKEPTLNKDIIDSIIIRELILKNATLLVNYQTIPLIFKKIKNDGMIMRYLKSDRDTMTFTVELKKEDVKIINVAMIDVRPTLYGFKDDTIKIENIAAVELSPSSIIIDIIDKSDWKVFSMYIGVEEPINDIKIESDKNGETTLWMVQQFVSGVWDHRKQEYEHCCFELTGIYDSKQKADDACLDETYVVSPIPLNHTFPKERVEAKDSYYPRQKKSEVEENKCI
jgi:hypothetical protein